MRFNIFCILIMSICFASCDKTDGVIEKEDATLKYLSDLSIDPDIKEIKNATFLAITTVENKVTKDFSQGVVAIDDMLKGAEKPVNSILNTQFSNHLVSGESISFMEKVNEFKSTDQEAFNRIITALRPSYHQEEIDFYVALYYTSLNGGDLESLLEEKLNSLAKGSALNQDALERVNILITVAKTSLIQAKKSCLRSGGEAAVAGATVGIVRGLVVGCTAGSLGGPAGTGAGCLTGVVSGAVTGAAWGFVTGFAGCLLFG